MSNLITTPPADQPSIRILEHSEHIYKLTTKKYIFLNSIAILHHKSCSVQPHALLFTCEIKFKLWVHVMFGVVTPIPTTTLILVHVTLLWLHLYLQLLRLQVHVTLLWLHLYLQLLRLQVHVTLLWLHLYLKLSAKETTQMRCP